MSSVSPSSLPSSVTLRGGWVHENIMISHENPSRQPSGYALGSKPLAAWTNQHPLRILSFFLCFSRTSTGYFVLVPVFELLVMDFVRAVQYIDIISIS